MTEKFILAIFSWILILQQSEGNETHFNDNLITEQGKWNSTEMEQIEALLDFEVGRVIYKDITTQACFAEHLNDISEFSYFPEEKHSFQMLKDVSPVASEFCGKFPIYSLEKSSIFHERKRRSVRGYDNYYNHNYRQSSQSQVQGQVNGQGYFSGQAQSQYNGGSQSQVQLGGSGIVGSLSSSSGNAQAQISLTETMGSGQAGSNGMGPSNSQVQIQLDQNRGSMASASVHGTDVALGYRSDQGVTGQNTNNFGQSVNRHDSSRYPGEERHHQGTNVPFQPTYSHIFPQLPRAQTATFPKPQAFNNGNAGMSSFANQQRGSANNLQLSQKQPLSYSGQKASGSGSYGSSGQSSSPYHLPNHSTHIQPPLETHQESRNGGRESHYSKFSSSNNNNYNGQANLQHPNVGAYSYASPLTHSSASSGRIPGQTSLSQSQAQSQTVYLGRGTSQFYNSGRESFGTPSFPNHFNGKFQHQPSIRDHYSSPGFSGTHAYPALPSSGAGNSQTSNYQGSSHTGGNGYGYGSYLLPSATTSVPVNFGRFNGQGLHQSYSNHRKNSETTPYTTPRHFQTYDYFNRASITTTTTTARPTFGTYASHTNQQITYRPTTTTSRSSHYSSHYGSNYPARQQSHVSGSGFYPAFGITQVSDTGKVYCTVITFTCTIMIESNGRAKICRPNGRVPASSTQGNGGSKICCC